MGNATSIFNLMRNIGASVGIAMVETMQVRKAQMHINILDEHVNPANPLARQTIDGLRALFMSQGKDAVTATRDAYAAVWAMVQQQAAMLAYNDAFRFLALDVRGDAAADIPDAQTKKGESRDGALSARREQSSIFCRYLILDLVVFRLRDDTTAGQFRGAAVRPSGDDAIGSFALIPGRFSNCSLLALFTSRGWSRFHPSFTP